MKMLKVKTNTASHTTLAMMRKAPVKRVVALLESTELLESFGSVSN